MIRYVIIAQISAINKKRPLDNQEVCRGLRSLADSPEGTAMREPQYTVMQKKEWQETTLI